MRNQKVKNIIWVCVTLFVVYWIDTWNIFKGIIDFALSVLGFFFWPIVIGIVIAVIVMASKKKDRNI